MAQWTLKGEIIGAGLIYSSESWKLENPLYPVAEDYTGGDIGETLIIRIEW